MFTTWEEWRFQNMKTWHSKVGTKYSNMGTPKHGYVLFSSGNMVFSCGDKGTSHSHVETHVPMFGNVKCDCMQNTCFGRPFLVYFKKHLK
jgi:hypothetical protein